MLVSERNWCCIVVSVKRGLQFLIRITEGAVLGHDWIDIGKDPRHNSVARIRSILLSGKWNEIYFTETSDIVCAIQRPVSKSYWRYFSIGSVLSDPSVSLRIIPCPIMKDSGEEEESIVIQQPSQGNFLTGHRNLTLRLNPRPKVNGCTVEKITLWQRLSGKIPCWRKLYERSDTTFRERRWQLISNKEIMDI